MVLASFEHIVYEARCRKWRQALVLHVVIRKALRHFIPLPERNSNRRYWMTVDATSRIKDVAEPETRHSVPIRSPLLGTVLLYSPVLALSKGILAHTPMERGPLLRMLDGYGGTLLLRGALRLAPVLVMRPGELRKAEWAGIDLESAEWCYTVTKTGRPHFVPLTRQAVSDLREFHSLTRHGYYVFHNSRYPQHLERPLNHTTLWSAYRAPDIPRRQITLHGFRMMARTILDEVLGFRFDFIELQLVHAVRDPNGRANNRTVFLPERRRMMHVWADYLDQLRAGEDIYPGTLRRQGLANIPGPPWISTLGPVSRIQQPPLFKLQR